MATDEASSTPDENSNREALLRLIWKRDFESHREIYDALEDE